MNHSFVRLALGLSLFLGASVSQADICVDMGRQAERWDLIGYALDDLTQNAMNPQYAMELNEAMNLEAIDSLELARLLTAEGGYLAETYGKPLTAALNALDQSADLESTYAAMAQVYTLINTASEECASSEPEDAVQQGGRFIVTYYEPLADQMEPEYVTHYNGMINSLKATGQYQATADLVSATLRLPHDVPINFAFCGVANAFYQPQQTTITMCYEFFDMVIGTLSSENMEVAEFEKAINGVGNYVLLHEIGHALVHLLEIPITGREEDSADSLASLIMIQTGNVEALTSAMLNYGLMADLSAQSNAGEYPFHDEHSMDAQRMFDMMCLIYGSDPEAYAGIASEDALPVARAQRCPYEYLQKDRSWNTLLGPHFLVN